MISSILKLLRFKRNPTDKLREQGVHENVPILREVECVNPYRRSSETSEPYYSREAYGWDIVNIHNAFSIIVYSWRGCRETIDYRCNHYGKECDCDRTSIMLSSRIVDKNGLQLDLYGICELYGGADDGTIIRTMSGTIYRLCGSMKYYDKWSSGSIFCCEDGLHPMQ